MSCRVALNFADGRTRFIDVHQHETVVEAALRHAVLLPVDCREGVCGTCRGVCVAGEYDMKFVGDDTLTQGELAEGAVLGCQMQPRTDCIVKFDFDSSLAVSAGPRQVHRARLCSIEQVSSAVSIIELELPAGAGLDYLPGQYAHLNVPGTSSWRSYSFANASNADGRLKFIIRLLPNGEMSDYLRLRARVGDVLELQAPFGSFYMRKRTRPVLFLAGGTGLSAFLSMLDELSCSEAPRHPITLLYGVTDAADFCEMDRLQACEAMIANFRFRAIALNAPPGWQGRCGLVTNLLDDADLHGGRLDVYVCGPPAMVAAVNADFRQRRFEEVRIYIEKFSASSEPESELV